MWPGDRDLALAVDDLGARLPEPLLPLAEIAFDLGWTWAPDGTATFAAVDPDRWERSGANAVSLLRDVPQSRLRAAAADPSLVARAWHGSVPTSEPSGSDRGTQHWGIPAHPVAFLGAEFGVHRSLPVYSGGLGVLAGDILKEASDLGLPMVAVGLLYRTGYFHQRIDTSGWQHEYWLVNDTDRLPCVRVSDAAGDPLEIAVPVMGGLRVGVWRVDVGRVPLYLLDSDLPANPVIGRWVTSRLYEANHSIRLAQYAVLGVGAARTLEALGIRPSVFHLNEGHPALAALELVHRALAAGSSVDEAWSAARDRIVFTTHTPVPAGNESYDAAELMSVLGEVAALAGDPTKLVSMGRVHPDAEHESPGMTPFALRVARSTNGVSRRHGEVAREMWRPVFGDRPADVVPIGHVTNGVHIPTWMAGPMRELLDRHLGADWWRRADDDATWDPVEDIPDAELWSVRCQQRRHTVAFVSQRALSDRLRRSEDLPYVVGRRARLRCRSAHDRIRPPAGHLQAIGSARARARPLAGAARERASGAVPVRRQGPPKRRWGQAARPAPLRAQARRRGGRPRGLPRGLRPVFRRDARSRVRRVGEPATSPSGGQWHQRHEVGAQRWPAALGARRVVGRGLRRHQRLGDRWHGRLRPGCTGLAPRERADGLPGT